MTREHEKAIDSSKLSSKPEGVEGFACKDLAEMGLPEHPSTVQGWHKLVEREQWPWREVRAQGGKAGVKRLYQPPPAVLALIRGRQLSQSFNEYRVTVCSGKPLQTAISDFVNDYNTVPGIANFVDGLPTITEADVEAARGLSQQDAGTIDPAARKSVATRPAATNHAEVMERTAPMVARCTLAAVHVLGAEYGRDQAVSLGIDTWGALCRMFPPDRADYLLEISDTELERLTTFILNTKATLYSRK